MISGYYALPRQFQVLSQGWPLYKFGKSWCVQKFIICMCFHNTAAFLGRDDVWCVKPGSRTSGLVLLKLVLYSWPNECWWSLCMLPTCAHDLSGAVEDMKVTVAATHRKNTSFTLVLNYAPFYLSSYWHPVQEVFVTVTQDQNKMLHIIFTFTF